MNINRIVPTLCFVLPVVLITICVSRDSLKGNATWSSDAYRLPYDGNSRDIEIRSPDRKKKAIIKGTSFSIVFQGIELAGLEGAGVASLAELGWSPNSTGIFVNQSYGGAVGEWTTTVYLLSDSTIEALAVTGNAIADFKKQYSCKEPEEPNVAVVTWLENSGRLLLVTEVPPHSSCPEMGLVRGYIVSLPNGEIVEEIDEAELKEVWESIWVRDLVLKKREIPVASSIPRTSAQSQ